MREKTIFFCTDCGFETAKWQGKCPGCGAWNTLVESSTVTGKTGNGAVRASAVRRAEPPKRLSEIDSVDEVRIGTGLGELDRVLGGGAVVGSLVLVGGEPGIGKSTLLLQICAALCAERRVLYVSGEESLRQLKMRAARLGVDTPNLFAVAETNLEDVMEAVDSVQPDVLMIDSIQTVYDPAQTAAPGSVPQIKACTMSLMRVAKGMGTTVFVVGHVNKEGALAGPKVLEHMVDCVLSFEGDRSFAHRILRADKNRFGSTNEIGVFEMANDGLREIPNPSELLLSGRPVGVPGSCIACVMEGSRPVLAEIQALVAPTVYGNPRRMCTGLDYNRAAMLLAVVERRGGLVVSNRDAYINVVGGLRVDEPAADLAALLAVVSGLIDRPVGEDTAAFGEVGLAGELRSVTNAEERLNEIRRLGFKKCILPLRGTQKIPVPDGLELIRVRDVRQAVDAVF